MQEASKPKGLAKFKREMKRPFRQIYQSLFGQRILLSGQKILPWFDRKIRRMSREEYVHHIWRRLNFTIGKDGRVSVPVLGVSVGDRCNLKCEYCGNFVPFRNRSVSKETLIDSFEKWSRKIAPEVVGLSGGESLLNPDIVEIIAAVKHYWPQSWCHIGTNGILLPRVQDELLQGLREHNVLVAISQHLDTEEYRDILKQALSRLEQFQIQYSILDSFQRWRKVHGIDGNGVPVTYRSNPRVAYRNCFTKVCVAMHGDYLYKCGFLRAISHGCQEGALGPEWNQASTHKPAIYDSSPQEIRNYLLGGVMPECSVCPEEYEIVEARQLTREDIQQIKSHIRQRIQKVA